MSHTGNWHRSPRKMALELARAKADATALAAAPPRELVFEIFPPSLDGTHPCHAVSKDWGVTATCTCGKQRWLDLKPLLSTHLAHAPWPRVMRSLTCDVCKGQPVLLSFATAPSGLDYKRTSFGHVRVRLA